MPRNVTITCVINKETGTENDLLRVTEASKTMTGKI
jgi:predicted RNA-binding protein YlxR (DUF448 family)